MPISGSSLNALQICTALDLYTPASTKSGSCWSDIIWKDSPVRSRRKLFFLLKHTDSHTHNRSSTVIRNIPEINMCEPVIFTESIIKFLCEISIWSSLRDFLHAWRPHFPWSHETVMELTSTINRSIYKVSLDALHKKPC